MFFFFFTFRDWRPHTADHPGCFGHRRVCWVDSTEGQAWSDHPALRSGWWRGSADHLPPAAYTQPVLPAGKQRGCEGVQTCVRERNESSCSFSDSITLTRCRAHLPSGAGGASRHGWNRWSASRKLCAVCMFVKLACFLVRMCMFRLGYVQA